jgi:GIY-YIG catalytic domain
MKGIIYKITCNETGEVYYGSTQQSLNVRMICHKASCKQWKEGKCGFTTSYQIIDRGNYSYSLIETVECEDRKQLEARERFYIESNECINKNIAGRTVKEYHEDNKETIKAYRKAYDEANKDHRNELRRQRRAKAKLLKNI